MPCLSANVTACSTRAREDTRVGIGYYHQEAVFYRGINKNKATSSIQASRPVWKLDHHLSGRSHNTESMI
jgi:hypothetical protein